MKFKDKKEMEEELGCDLKVQNELFMRIQQSYTQLTKQSIKKFLIHKTPMRLLRIEFKLDNTVKSKAFKYFVDKYVPVTSKAV